MSERTPPMTATLEWDSELQFTGFAGKHEVSIDGSAEAAPNPMQMLALSLAGCMSSGLLHILTRGRHDVRGLKVAFTGERAVDAPRRFVAVRLHFTLSGAMEPEHVERAVRLSRDKYCSVWNSLQRDIDLEVTYEIEAAEM